MISNILSQMKIEETQMLSLTHMVLAYFRHVVDIYSRIFENIGEMTDLDHPPY